MLKKVNTETHPHEVEISRFLSSEGLASDPRNHCVHLLDVLPDPKEEHTTILVLPLLRSYDNPDFVTVGEVVACLQQLIEVSMCLGTLVWYELRSLCITGTAFHACTTYRPPVCNYDYLGRANSYVPTGTYRY